MNARDGGKKKSGDVSERGGAFAGDAILRKHFPELAEGVIDVGGGAKFAGDGFEFVANATGFEQETLLAGVEGAESWIGGMEKHGATATVGSGVRATLRFARRGGRFLLRGIVLRNLVFDLSGHGDLLMGWHPPLDAMLPYEFFAAVWRDALIAAFYFRVAWAGGNATGKKFKGRRDRGKGIGFEPWEK